MTIVGIDLAINPRSETGLAIIDNSGVVSTQLLRTDMEIVDAVMESGPDLIAINAPISLPKGRDCLEYNCACRRHGSIRQSERQLLKAGVHVFPCCLGKMRSLTKRAIALRRYMEEVGFHVIEVPGSSTELLGLRHQNGGTRAALRAHGVVVKTELVESELDALTTALIGKYYLSDRFTSFGSPDEGFIILPRLPEE